MPPGKTDPSGKYQEQRGGGENQCGAFREQPKAIVAEMWWARGRAPGDAEGGAEGKEGRPRPRQQVTMRSLTFVLTAGRGH